MRANLQRGKKRQGNYTVLMILMLSVLLGFGALSVDVSLMRLAQSEAQDIADAAAHAAIVELKRTGDYTKADLAAREVVAANTVIGAQAELLDLDFGSWDNSGRTFTSTTQGNGVRVQVGRTGVNSVPLLLAPLLGWMSVEVTGNATAATQRLQAILVMDITGSWAQKNFVKARDAAVAFLDELHANHGDDDEVGMVVFYNRYAYEFTPLTKVVDSAANPSLVRAKWSALNVGSYAGDYQSTWATGTFLTSKHVACKVYETDNNGGNPFSGLCTTGSSCYKKGYRNNFSVSIPAGGCFPNMPRYYMDEGGTDHTTGLAMARQMFQASNDATAYKALVMLTDGQPAAYTSSEGVRKATSYKETRWKEYKRSGAHSVSQIQAETPVAAQAMYTDYGVNIWFLSFVESGQFMADSVTGDGWYAVITNSAQLVPVFRKIAQSLPVSIVQ